MKNKILCIEDDLTIQTLIAASLKNFDVICVKTLKEAQSELQSQNTFEVILVDIQLPDGDGLRFLAEVSENKKHAHAPIMILSSHSEISNKVMAFSYGAEDFISKPFDPIELNARVTAKVRKRQNHEEHGKTRKIGNLLLDFDRQKAFAISEAKEKDLQLTGIELKILNLLTKRMEQVYSREQIMDQVWGKTFISDRTVDSHIAHLRQKISVTQVQVETAKNFGYRTVLKQST